MQELLDFAVSWIQDDQFRVPHKRCHAPGLFRMMCGQKTAFLFTFGQPARHMTLFRLCLLQPGPNRKLASTSTDRQKRNMGAKNGPGQEYIIPNLPTVV